MTKKDLLQLIKDAPDHALIQVGARGAIAYARVAAVYVDTAIVSSGTAGMIVNEDYVIFLHD